MHIASAAVSKCDYFITCDNEIIKKSDFIESFLIALNFNLRIINPVEFITKVSQ